MGVYILGLSLYWYIVVIHVIFLSSVIQLAFELQQNCGEWMMQWRGSVIILRCLCLKHTVSPVPPYKQQTNSLIMILTI